MCVRMFGTHALQAGTHAHTALPAVFQASPSEVGGSWGFHRLLSLMNPESWVYSRVGMQSCSRRGGCGRGYVLLKYWLKTQNLPVSHSHA